MSWTEPLLALLRAAVFWLLSTACWLVDRPRAPQAVAYKGTTPSRPKAIAVVWAEDVQESTVQMLADIFTWCKHDELEVFCMYDPAGALKAMSHGIQAALQEQGCRVQVGWDSSPVGSQLLCGSCSKGASKEDGHRSAGAPGAAGPGEQGARAAPGSRGAPPPGACGCDPAASGRPGQPPCAAGGPREAVPAAAAEGPWAAATGAEGLAAAEAAAAQEQEPNGLVEGPVAAAVGLGGPGVGSGAGAGGCPGDSAEPQRAASVGAAYDAPAPHAHIARAEAAADTAARCPLPPPAEDGASPRWSEVGWCGGRLSAVAAPPAEPGSCRRGGAAAACCNGDATHPLSPPPQPSPGPSLGPCAPRGGGEPAAPAPHSGGSLSPCARTCCDGACAPEAGRPPSGRAPQPAGEGAGVAGDSPSEPSARKAVGSGASPAPQRGLGGTPPPPPQQQQLTGGPRRGPLGDQGGGCPREESGGRTGASAFLLSAEDGYAPVLQAARTGGVCSGCGALLPLRAAAYREGLARLRAQMAALAGRAVLVQPELVLVVGPVLSLAGYPPFQVAASEILHLGRARRLDRAAVDGALAKYMCTEQRFGK